MPKILENGGSADMALECEAGFGSVCGDKLIFGITGSATNGSLCLSYMLG